jgi:hypothetical protein
MAALIVLFILGMVGAWSILAGSGCGRPVLPLLAFGLVLLMSLTACLRLYLRAATSSRSSESMSRERTPQSDQGPLQSSSTVLQELRAPLQALFTTVELLLITPQSPSVARLAERLDESIDQIDACLDPVACRHGARSGSSQRQQKL